jgi:DNA-binding CsgD family transcriptional regulator
LGIWHDVIVHPIFNRSGDLEYLAIFAHDISEFKKLEKMLKESNNELEKKIFERTSELEEINTALRVLIKNRDLDVKEIEEKIVFNIHQLVIPNLEGVKKSKLNKSQGMLIEVIEKNLNQIASDFINGISHKHLTLTPSEIKVSNLIRHGKTNKEIAKFQNVSERTVESQRASIRKKIGIKNKKVNLRSHLMANS